MTKPSIHRMTGTDLAAATALGKRVLTLCGLEQVPRYDTQGLPACPRCERVLPIVKDAIADGWDEGWNSRQIAHENGVEGVQSPWSNNPYRSES